MCGYLMPDRETTQVSKYQNLHTIVKDINRKVIPTLFSVCINYLCNDS